MIDAIDSEVRDALFHHVLLSQLFPFRYDNPALAPLLRSPSATLCIPKNLIREMPLPLAASQPFTLYYH